MSNERRPTLCIVAGPNGSGKTTTTIQLLESEWSADSLYINPDTEFVLGDICKIDPNTIPDCDGFIGGPPCQSWSVAGRQKGLEDERGQLFLK